MTGIAPRSRAMEILRRNEDKRQAKINSLLETQRISIREDVLNNLDEGRDSYLDIADMLTKRIGNAETELHQIENVIKREVESAKHALTETKSAIAKAQAEAERHLADVVERTTRLKELNEREETAFKTQERIFEEIAKATKIKTDLEPQVIETSKKLTAMKRTKTEIPRDFMSSALTLFKSYKDAEELIAVLEKSSINGRGGMNAMLEQRTKDLREAYEATKKVSEKADQTLATVASIQHEIALEKADNISSTRKYVVEKLILMGMNEFLEEEEA